MVRTPGLRGASYVTPAGFEALRRELDWLWRDERRRVTAEVAAAAAQGDRSENAEYIYGKKRLREIDRRIRYLSKRLDELTVVREAPPRRDRVYFGAWVTLEDEAGAESRYRLVGPDEFDVERRRISIESPLGRALLGREVGDEIELKRPRGTLRYVLLEIEYE
jgi:transcription elongation factor GreB